MYGVASWCKLCGMNLKYSCADSYTVDFDLCVLDIVFFLSVKLTFVSIFLVVWFGGENANIRLLKCMVYAMDFLKNLHYHIFFVHEQ